MKKNTFIPDAWDMLGRFPKFAPEEQASLPIFSTSWQRHPSAYTRPRLEGKSGDSWRTLDKWPALEVAYQRDLLYPLVTKIWCIHFTRMFMTCVRNKGDEGWQERRKEKQTQRGRNRRNKKKKDDERQDPHTQDMIHDIQRHVWCDSRSEER